MSFALAPWTPERTDALRQLWAEGLTCAKIAERLGHTSRNAVICKVSRLGLPARAARGANRKRGGQSNGPRKSPKPAQHLWETEVFDRGDVAHTTLVDRELNQCNWIIGEPRDGMMCGLPIVPGSKRAWCTKHAERGRWRPDESEPVNTPVPKPVLAPVKAPKAPAPPIVIEPPVPALEVPAAMPVHAHTTQCELNFEGAAI
jgi:hypothetical protein